MAKFLTGVAIVILLALCVRNCNNSEDAAVPTNDTTGIQDTSKNIPVPADTTKHDSVK